jgi:hypothetical protein
MARRLGSGTIVVPFRPAVHWRRYSLGRTLDSTSHFPSCFMHAFLHARYARRRRGLRVLHVLRRGSGRDLCAIKDGVDIRDGCTNKRRITDLSGEHPAGPPPRPCRPGHRASVRWRAALGLPCSLKSLVHSHIRSLTAIRHAIREAQSKTSPDALSLFRRT